MSLIGIHTSSPTSLVSILKLSLIPRLRIRSRLMMRSYQYEISFARCTSTSTVKLFDTCGRFRRIFAFLFVTKGPPVLFHFVVESFHTRSFVASFAYVM